MDTYLFIKDLLWTSCQFWSWEGSDKRLLTDFDVNTPVPLNSHKGICPGNGCLVYLSTYSQCLLPFIVAQRLCESVRRSVVSDSL